MKIKLFEQFLNEGFGVQAIEKSLQSYAESKKLTFKKLDTIIKKGNYGSSTSFTSFQFGNKFVVVKYEKVAGAPRFNSVKVFITEAQGLDAKSMGAIEPYTEGDLTYFLINILLKREKQ